MLRKKNQQKKARGVFSKKGVQIAPRPTWAFQEVLQKAVASGGSNPARLGKLGGKLLPQFSINWGRSEVKKGSAPEALLSLSNLLGKIVSVKKI